MATVTETEFLWAQKQRVNSVCFISDEDIMISGNGSTITFTDLTTGESKYYRCSGENEGDGVEEITGHKTLPIFAFTEMCYSPKIFVLTYPNFEIISTCHDKMARSYLQITFTETEHLIALTSMPDFIIQVWFWRLGTKQYQIYSNIFSDHQIIRCSTQLPITVAQLGLNSGQMNVYEVHGSMDLTRLIERKINLPFTETDGPFFCVFGHDGLINLVTGNGNIYHVSPVTGTCKLIIKWTGEQLGCVPIITNYKSGLIMIGPNSHLKYFKRQSGAWIEVFSVPQQERITFMRTPFSKDIVIGVQENAAILKIIPDATDKSEIITTIDDWNTPLKNFTMIKPSCEFICTLDIYNNMCLFKTETGALIYCTHVGKIRVMEEHPFLPYVAFGYDNGVLALISFHDIHQPTELAKFYLCLKSIQMIRFFSSGDYLLCTDADSSSYLIKCTTGGIMEIILTIPSDDTFIDMSLNGIDDKQMKIMFLIGITEEGKRPIAGIFVNYTIVNFKLAGKVSKHDLALPGKYCRVEAFGDGDLYFAAQYIGYEIHVLTLEKSEKYFFFTHTQSIRTVHQLKHVDFNLVDNRFLVTWGFDGFIGVYDTAIKKNIVAFTGNQRRTLGTRKVRFDPFRNVITLIGHSGNLHCVKLKNVIYEDFIDYRSAVLPQEFRDFVTALKRDNRLSGYIPNVPHGRWTEIKKSEAIAKESEIYRNRREHIKTQLDELREKLKVLLDSNEIAPENEKLEIQDFNLNTEASQNMIEIARKNRQQEHDQMQNFILEQNRVSNWIKAHCWDTMLVKGTKIWGIFTNLSVENYTLLESHAKFEKEMKKIRQARASELLVSYNDIFEPWVPQTVSKLELTVLQRPQIHETEEIEDDSDKMEINYSLEGTSISEYITPISIRYPQLQTVSFYQLFIERVLGRHENLELRKFFNKKLIELQELKKIEVATVKQRNERKREIHRELNILLKLKGSKDRVQGSIIDPEFASEEIPETIIEIQDYEIPVKPYISPSRQKILDEEAEEAERKRLALLADDFRERALEVMMNGVLEIKWEDEIKKTPPPPECVTSGKDPKTYDEADLKAIQQHEDTLAFLRGERDRYQVILEEEEAKLQQNLDSQIMKFNVKVCQMHLLKIKVDAAIKQEELKLLRKTWRQFERIVLDRRDQSCREELLSLNEQISKLNVVLRELEQKVLDLRHEYETLVTKDRMLDKQFKSNFVETAPRSIIDQVYKIFKRRPKWQVRAWASTPIILDLAKRVITRNTARTGPPLPPDCYEFLTMLQQMDSSAVAPSAIDDSLWQLICKMRRIKIESEFKVKACGLQLAEIENACNTFVKEVASRKNEIIALNARVEDVHDQRVIGALDRHVQLVVKRGMVEIDLKGHLSDFDNSILLHYSDVNKINTVIRKEGMKKLRTMQNAAKFRRKIIYKEWEHHFLRNKVRDLEDYIKTIDKCKITKEIQRWLKYKEHGWTEDISQKALERGIDSAIKSCERTLNDQRKTSDELQEKLEAKRKENKKLDKQIQELNVVVTERQMARDLILEEREEKGRRQRMQALLDRANLVRQVQEQHAQILQLSTTLELQRLRTFPTLSVFNPEEYNNMMRAGCKF